MRTLLVVLASLPAVLPIVAAAQTPETAPAPRELKRPLTATEERGLSVFENATAAIPTRHLSEPELNELLRFYQSPLGTKMLGLGTTLVQEGERIFQSRQREFTEHLLGELKRELPRPAP